MRFDSEFMAKVWRVLVVLLVVGMVAGLLLACSGGGKHEAEKERDVRIEASPRKAETTAGRELPLKYTLYGLTSQDVLWTVLEPNGGQVTPAGVYAAPAKAGVYHVNVQSLVAPHAMDTAEIKVHPQPVAESLTADRKWVRPGGSCTLTAVFHGGEGIVQPGGIRMESGVPKSFTPGKTTEYVLRVSNPLGVIAERTAKVDVAAALVQMRDINAPEVVRVGNFHVAWVERRVGAQLEWSSDDVIFLGGQERPSSPVVVFTPRENAQEYQLRVKAVGGEDLEPAGESPEPLLDKAPGRKAEAPAAEEVVFTFKGKVEKPSPDQPVIVLDAHYLSTAKPGCKAKVGNPRPGTTYAWKIRNGAFKDGGAAGQEVEFSTSKADYLLLTCEATTEATGAVATATTAVLLVPPPLPPVINTEDHPVARMVEWAYVKDVKGGEKYRWEIAKEGTLGDGGQTAAAPLVKYKVLSPGPCILKCWAANLAGDESEPTVRTLTAVGPFVLDPPKLQVADIIKAQSGPYTAEVLDPVPGLQYQWSGENCVLASGSGASVVFESKDKILVLKCTATEPATGKSSYASLAREVVFAPGIPEIVAPSSVEPGKPYVAAVKLGGRPDLTYRWELENGTLDPAAKEDRRVIAPFTAGKAIGDYKLTLWAVNRAGEESAPKAVFKGKVENPLPPTGGDTTTTTGGGTTTTTGGGTTTTTGGGSTTSGGGSTTTTTGGGSSSTKLSISYIGMTLTVGQAMTPQLPNVQNASGGALLFKPFLAAPPDGIVLDPATGELSGTPTTTGLVTFAVTVTDGPTTVASPSFTYIVQPAGQPILTYPPLSGLKSRVAMAKALVPAVSGTTKGVVPAFKISAGALPKGLELDAAGQISGTPWKEGGYAFTVTVEDWQRKADFKFTGTVAKGPALVVDYPDHEVLITEMSTASADVKNAIGTDTKFALVGPALPEHLGLDPDTGNIAYDGDPGIKAGIYKFKVDVHNADENAVTRDVTWTVRDIAKLVITKKFQAEPLVGGVDREVKLSWDFTGDVTGISLDREPPFEDGSKTKILAITDRAFRCPPLPRQKFTLGLSLPGGPQPPDEQELSVHMEVVAPMVGTATEGFPNQEYVSGDKGDGRLRKVAGLAFHDGKLYFSEGEDDTIRAYDPKDGSVEPLSGILRGPAVVTTATDYKKRLNDPGSLAVAKDSSGAYQLLVCDRGSHTIRKLSLAGGRVESELLAGVPGQKGHKDGDAATAEFGTLGDIAVVDRIAFVADLDSGIRMINLDTLKVKTLDYPLPHLLRPSVLAAGGQGFRVFVVREVTDKNGKVIQDGVIHALVPRRATDPEKNPPQLANAADLWDAKWTQVAFADTGSYRNTRSAAQFSTVTFKDIRGLAVNGNQLLVAAGGNQSLWAIPLSILPKGTGELLAGSEFAPGFTEMDKPEARFDSPRRVAAGVDALHLWVADQAGTVLRSVAWKQNFTTSAGTVLVRTEVRSILRTPRLVSVPNIQGLTEVAKPDAPQDAKDWAGKLREPWGVAVERETGDIFIADAGSNALRRLITKGRSFALPEGALMTFAGKLKAKPESKAGPQALKEARFDAPTQIGLDGKARHYILDTAGTRLLMIDKGMVSVLDDKLPSTPGRPSQLAVRAGGKDPQLRVLATGEEDATVHPAVSKWTIQPYSVNASAVATAQTPILLTGKVRVRAVAVGQDNRIYVAVEERDRQVCTLRIYQPKASTVPMTWDEVKPAYEFGPGGAIGQAWGLPEIRSMAVDTRHRVFLADAANGLVWMLGVDKDGKHGKLGPMAGNPSTHQLRGEKDELYHGFKEPLYVPTGLAVDNRDDLILTGGDALFKITAPGTADAKWAEPNAVAWSTQTKHNGGSEKPEDKKDKGDDKPKLDAAQMAKDMYDQGVAAQAAGKAEAAYKTFSLYLSAYPNGADIADVKLRLDAVRLDAAKARLAKADQAVTTAGAKGQELRDARVKETQASADLKNVENLDIADRARLPKAQAELANAKLDITKAKALQDEITDLETKIQDRADPLQKLRTARADQKDAVDKAAKALIPAIANAQQEVKGCRSLLAKVSPSDKAPIDNSLKGLDTKLNDLQKLLIPTKP